MKVPIASDIVQVKAPDNYKMTIKSYEVPESIFRGVLWPNQENLNFQLWVLKKSKEVFFEIPAPSNFKQYERETTEEWVFQLIDTTTSKKIYNATKKGTRATFQIEIPNKKRPYRFSVLLNDKNHELIAIMDISESIRDEGLFGYIIIEDED